MKLKEKISYHDNGNLHQHYFVNENGLIQGEYREWWYSNENKFKIYYIVNGKLHGECKSWYSNEDQWETYNYRNNNRFGISITKN